jgi:ATP-dependent metalloprotease FtsH
MDEKEKHQLRIEEPQRWHEEMRNYRCSISTFLRTQKHVLLTFCLLVLAAVLLFGIFSQLPPPHPESTAPQGVTVINYSEFVRQVQTKNVLAVSIQGNDLQGLLAHPLLQNRTSSATPVAPASRSNAADILAWENTVSRGSYSPPQTRTSASYQAKTPLSGIDPRRFYSRLTDGGDAKLMPLLLSNHVVVYTSPVASLPAWIRGLLWRCITLLFFVLLFTQLQVSRATMRSPGALNDRDTQISKNRARLFEHAKERAKPRHPPGRSPALRSSDRKAHIDLEPTVTFADVAGIDEVRVELEEIVQFLRSPERYQRLGARIPRGALLVGPPGTGKTLLAKAVAGEAGVPFFTISASEFVEVFVGIGASRVRTLFNQVRESAPSVIFIDELDAVGRKRSMNLLGNDERDQTLNQLLVELDGFDSRKAVVVLAATNRVDILDRALLRPGRFDRHITVSLPDRVGREAILKVHTRCTPLHEDVSLERVSRLTQGMSGADLENLVNEAALTAARQNLEQLTFKCFEDALARVQLGLLRPLVISEADRRIIAFHEGGHALVAYHLPGTDTVNRVTILPRGQSLGVTQFTCEDERYNYSRETLLARIAVGLGGRAAEELAFGLERVTTGAENDFRTVTEMARRMVTRWGMSEQVGIVFADSEPAEMSLNMRLIERDALQPKAHALVADANGRLLLHSYKEPDHQNTPARTGYNAGNQRTTMATVIDHEVQRIINEEYCLAHALLSEHYDQLTRIAEALLEYEQLDRRQFEALLQ